MSGRAVPEYRRAADVIKSRITPDDIGSLITIPEIQELADARYATARRTADLLTAEGILRPRQGKGYEVMATPAKAADQRADARELAAQVTQLRAEVRTLAAQLERVESNVEDLYEKLGYEYATDSTDERGDEPAPAARRGHAG